MKLTDDAANRTMDLIENATPLVGTLASAAADPSSPQVISVAAELRGNLSDVYLAQGYQDLTGQIVRGVIKLVDEVETTLAGMIRIGGEISGVRADAEPVATNGYGPVVPGVDHGAALGNQHDVDALLSDLGL